jgi:hypothetical protein
LFAGESWLAVIEFCSSPKASEIQIFIKIIFNLLQTKVVAFINNGDKEQHFSVQWISSSLLSWSNRYKMKI